MATPIHKGALRLFREEGVIPYRQQLPILIPFMSLFLALFISLAVSSNARMIFISIFPRFAQKLVGKKGVTDRYRYALIPILVCGLLVGGAFIVQKAESAHSQEYNIKSDFEDIGYNENLLWMIVFTSCGFDDGRFPNSLAGKLVSSLMGVIGIGGILLFIGLVSSDHIARKVKMSFVIDPNLLVDHIIVCGWNSRAHGITSALVTKQLEHRRQTVVILSEQENDLVSKYDLPPDHTLHIEKNPEDLKALQKAGLATAETVLILADNHLDLEHRDARSLLILLQVEKYSHQLCNEGKREHRIRTIVELIDPANRQIIEKAHATQIICQQEFDEKLLVQCVLNPGLKQFIQEILTDDRNNEVYEVPVTGNEPVEFTGHTFDEALVSGRRNGLLLLAINCGGAPGVIKGSDQAYQGSAEHPGMRTLLSNPFRPEEINYRIRQGDSLLFLAEDERDLEKIFGDATFWHEAFMPRIKVSISESE